MIDARLRLFIPSRAVIVPMPIAGEVGFDGDNRLFSYGEGTARADIWIDIDDSPTTTNPVRVKQIIFGESRWYTKDKLVDVAGKPFWWRDVRKDPFLGIEMPPNGRATAVVTGRTLNVAGHVEDADPFGFIKNIRVSFSVNGTNPLEALAPAIDCQLDLVVSATGAPTFTYSLTGTHDGFPAYELYLQQRLVYSFDPVREGTSPLELGGLSSDRVQVRVPLSIFV